MCHCFSIDIKNIYFGNDTKMKSQCSYEHGGLFGQILSFSLKKKIKNNLRKVPKESNYS